jgi:hypothetical protein
VAVLLAGLMSLLPCRHLLADDPVPAPAQSLVITEIMYNPPEVVGVPLGQWFEIYNPSDDVVALGGLGIEVVSAEPGQGGAVTLDPAESPALEGHGFLVLGASMALALNGGIPVDAAYGVGLTLPKTGGTLKLTRDAMLLDEVDFGPQAGLAVAPGISLSLEPAAMDPLANDAASRWCASTQPVPDNELGLMASPGAVGLACDSDNDGFDEQSGDCDDFDSKVYPGGAEKCNGVDDDCDGTPDNGELQGKPAWQAVGLCALGGPVCLGEEGWGVEYPEGFEEFELSCDMLDNDCDGQTDEGLRNGCGQCGEEPIDLCDGLDDDCDGKTDEDAATPPDGFECPTGKKGICRDSAVLCLQGAWTCTPPVGYEESESLCDGFDNDCNGATDEGFGIGGECAVGLGECLALGVFECSSDKTTAVCKGTEAPGLLESCGDNKDNDCDGLTDEGFDVGQSCEVGIGACRATGKLLCSPDGAGVICVAQALPPQDEVCANLVDDDCDGVTDEADCLPAEAEPATGCSAIPFADSALTWLLLPLIPLLLRRVRPRRPE